MQLLNTSLLKEQQTETRPHTWSSEPRQNKVKASIESMRTVFFTYVRLSLDFDFLHEAFVLVNVSTAPGATDIWLSVTLNELHTVTMRLTQFSMVFDISRFLRTIIGRDSRFLSIRFFCECHIFEKVTQCPQIRYHKPKILVKFC